MRQAAFNELGLWKYGLENLQKREKSLWKIDEKREISVHTPAIIVSCCGFVFHDTFAFKFR